jgi:diguanylate cyclase (GGDEF)-like protein
VIPPAAPGRLSRQLAERGPDWWSITELSVVGESPRVRRVLGIWLLALALSVATGILNVTQNWNGLELDLAGLDFAVTVYPPFVVSVLLALWLGPTWAGVAIYFANLASALASGMSPAMSALFALAGVIETLMLWGSMVMLRVDPNLRRLRDLGWFLGAALVAAVTASLAAILWNSSHALDPAAGQRVWRGWVIGDLLQIVVLVLPVLWLFGPRVRSWLDRQFDSPPNHDFSYTHGVGLIVAAFAILGLVVFLGVHQALGSIEVAIDARTATGDLLVPRLREIILVMGLLSTALIVATGMFSTALARLGERQRREAQVDSLTGSLNRRAFDDQFHKEAERSRRLGMGIAVLFLDLDRFKALNDRYGHAVGDRALERVAERVESALRETDLLFRWGGEEFVVLMPHTAHDEVGGVAERVRQAVGETQLLAVPGEGPLRVTASIGAAATDRFPADAAELVRRADEACYQAKSLGRDRVVVVAS